jgi:hypothetical protein
VTIGDLISSEHSFPALEYDSTRKLMWYFTPSGRPIALDFKQSPVARHRPTGPSINFTGGYVANACYMPSRDIMVYLLASTVGAPTNDAWYRYPRIFAYRLTGYTFGGAFNPTPFEVQCNPSASSYLTNISQGLPTGWPGYRVATAETNWMGATDNGNLMQGGPWGPATPANPSKVRGINDRLEYCSEEDCLLFVERHGGVEDGTARADQTQIKLWKLRPPAIGQESSGTWTWEVEVINQTIGSGGAGINKLNEMPAWGGKSKYAPALKCMYYTDRPNMPVQVIRSADWT